MEQNKDVRCGVWLLSELQSVCMCLHLLTVFPVILRCHLSDEILLKDVFRCIIWAREKCSLKNQLIRRKTSKIIKGVNIYSTLLILNVANCCEATPTKMFLLSACFPD